jgi:hypothetical protein
VQDQLVALGLLEPAEECRPHQPAGAEAPPACNHFVQIEARRVLAALLSFLDRAHGLRVQGLVAEFIQSSAGPLFLLSLHAIQWESEQSGARGRPSLPPPFTEQWADFLSGQGRRVGGGSPGGPGRPSRDDRPHSALRSRYEGAGGSESHSGVDAVSNASYSLRCCISSPEPSQDQGRWSSPLSPSARSTRGAHAPSAVQVGSPGLDRLAVYDVRPGSAPAIIVQRFAQRPVTTRSRAEKGVHPSLCLSLSFP